MRRFGIDVSRWQGDFDFARAKREAGVEFAILKIGGADDGFYQDSRFEDNYRKCEQAALDKGCYFFGHATSMDAAKKEAEYLISLLKDKRFSYPVFYDVEGDMLAVDKNTLTEICLYVLRTVQAAGYWVGIYTSDSHFESNVDDTRLKGFSHWVASYTSREPVLESGAQLQMWQFGGSINLVRDTDINGQTVDQNYCYVDYPAGIKAKGLNGYAKAPAAVENKTPALQHQINEEVEYEAIFRTSDSAEALEPIVSKGKITDVLPGKRNPYLINGGTGWVNDDVIMDKAAAPQRTCVVQPNDGFWTIAERELGDGSRMQEVWELNGMTKDTVIHPGDVLKLPN